MALRTEESRTQGAGREEREEGVDLGVCRARGYATHRGSWKPKSIDIDKRPERKFRHGFIGALSATGSQTSDKFPCLLLGGWGGIQMCKLYFKKAEEPDIKFQTSIRS